MSFFEAVSPSEVRSLAIFAGYLAVCASLSAFLIYTLVARYISLDRDARLTISSTRLVLFTILAALSLAATWFYMLSFFLHSYRAFLHTAFPAFAGGKDHLNALPPLARVLHLFGIESLPERRLKKLLAATPTLSGTVLRTELVARWLNRGSLFREAWEAACADPARFWSMQQIFGLTAAWSVFLGWQGRRCGVDFAPFFMLLGQLVSVSFAMNLFFVAVSLSSRRQTEKHKLSLFINNDPGLISPIVAWVAVLSTWVADPLLLGTANSAWFPLVLAAPHLLLFAPTLGLRGPPASVWRLLQVAVFLTAASQAIGGAYVLFQPEVSSFLSSTWLSMQREWAVQTRLSGALISKGSSALDILFKQPFNVQLTTLMEPFMAPSLTLLNVLEPLLSSALVSTIDSAAAGAREFVADPLVLGTYIAYAHAFLMQRVEAAINVMWVHPAVTSVSLDGIMCYFSVAAWLFTGWLQGSTVAETAIGGP